jgi:ABC-type Fe3+-hydroxamate transport system substrate-binding protein
MALAADAPVQAVDDAGRTVRLPRPAMRVVSLLPATTETLVAIGAGDRLVARTDYDDPALAHLPSVGGGLTPSLEVLASLRPDLVIAWEEAGTARVRPRLEELGIPVFAVQTRDTAAIFANIERFGRLTGLDRQADSVAAHLRAELLAVHASVAGRRAPAVAYMVSLDPPMIAGSELFIGEVIGVAGGRNLFPEVTAGSPQISLEEIVRRRPEIVVLPVGDDPQVVERLRRVAGWRELFADGRTRIVTVPVDILHRPGPAIARAARILREAIHPAAASDAQ